MIKVSFDPKDVKICWDFANKIITERNQYDRMIKHGLSNEDKTLYRIKRTFAGKLGEIAFFRYLEFLGINTGNFETMFEVFEGETNVDKFDFTTADGLTVDVKTAVFYNHKRLVVPNDQFVNMPKDFYVGVKLDVPDTITDYNDNFLANSIVSAYICGYTDYKTLENIRVSNLGEFPCRAIPLTELKDIKFLIEMFKN